MKREELLKSKEFWIGEIQLSLFELITDYLKKNKMNRTQFAQKMGVSKGYVSQIINGDFDHRISKFVELAMFIGKVPRVSFQDIEEVLKVDELGELYTNRYESINISLQLNERLKISLPENDLKASNFTINNLKFTDYEKNKTAKGYATIA